MMGFVFLKKEKRKLKTIVRASKVSEHVRPLVDKLESESQKPNWKENQLHK